MVARCLASRLGRCFCLQQRSPPAIRTLRTARNAIPYKKSVSFQQVPNMLFVLETAAARRGGSEEPRYQISANRAINCNLTASACLFLRA